MRRRNLVVVAVVAMVAAAGGSCTSPRSSGESDRDPCAVALPVAAASVGRHARLIVVRLVPDQERPRLVPTSTAPTAEPPTGPTATASGPRTPSKPARTSSRPTSTPTAGRPPASTPAPASSPARPSSAAPHPSSAGYPSGSPPPSPRRAPRPPAACVFAYEGPFDSGDLATAAPGRYEIAVVTVRHPHLIRLLATDRLPLFLRPH